MLLLFFFRLLLGLFLFFLFFLRLELTPLIAIHGLAHLWREVRIRARQYGLRV